MVHVCEKGLDLSNNVCEYEVNLLSNEFQRKLEENEKKEILKDTERQGFHQSLKNLAEKRSNQEKEEEDENKDN